jgi:8-oxo-dGTP pyrophosphatase MutT (NUDIX family)
VSEWTKQVRAAGAKPTGAEVRPAATAVMLRDGATGLEVLLVKRSSKMAFHGGAWVFPGGRIDEVDWHETDDDIVPAARRAAARESREEAGIEVDADALIHISNWTTPEISPKRFATWFFAGAAGEGHELAVADGVESEALRWFRPGDALGERSAGEIELAPPQFVTLLSLTRFDLVEDALAVLEAEDPIDFQPRFVFLDGGGAVAIYSGDGAYDDTDKLTEPGPRHRMLMGDAGWVYEKGY